MQALVATHTDALVELRDVPEPTLPLTKLSLRYMLFR